MAYCTANDIYNCYGTTNITKWADLDNDGNLTTIANRIAVAIAWADNEINTRLRNGMYVIPFATAPADIVNLSATLAGVWLYESRGISDFDPDSGKAVHRLSAQRDRAYKMIREIIAGIRKLDAEYAVEIYPRGA